jgi:putative transcriptional regulator
MSFVRHKARDRSSGLTETFLEVAEGMHRIGLMDEAVYREIVVRYIGPNALDNLQPISGQEIRALRSQAKMSQAALAQRFNVSPSYISQLERGVKQPKGPALALLNVVRRKGVEAIL